jgi:uncharacterized protein (TIGR03437 family)
VALAVIGIRPTRINCSRLAVTAGDSFTCNLRLSTSNVPAVARLSVASGNTGFKLPRSITTRPGQTDLSFTVYTDPLSTGQASAVVVSFGQTQVASIITVAASVNPILGVPGRQYLGFGNPVSFTVSATDPGALPLTLSAVNLPAGASFDASSGNFSWTPDESQQGTYTVSFTATNSAGGSSSADVAIQVDAGKPVITDVRNAASQAADAACSPGSIASLMGRWLSTANPPVSDGTGSSTQLGGVQVNVNGTYAPVLYASVTRVDFVCPASDPGSVLNISVENAAGTTDPVQTTVQAIAPAVFSADGSGKGQGMVVLSGTSLLATPRTYLNAGQPAEPGDSIAIFTTGIGPAGGILPQIKIGDLSVTADSVQEVPGMAGVIQILATVPAGLPVGDALPLVVQVTAPDGSVVQTNTVTVAIENARQ